jgi:hypothetical protein
MKPACLEIKVAPSNIGRIAIIDVQGHRLYGNVMDLIHGTDKPKRIRIQHGAMQWQGNVVQPHEYVFIGWADEEED